MSDLNQGLFLDWLLPMPIDIPQPKPSFKTDSKLLLEVKSPEAVTDNAGIFDIFLTLYLMKIKTYVLRNHLFPIEMAPTTPKTKYPIL
jgi:hypothetical protein